MYKSSIGVTVVLSCIRAYGIDIKYSELCAVRKDVGGNSHKDVAEMLMGFFMGTASPAPPVWFTLRLESLSPFLPPSPFPFLSVWYTAQDDCQILRAVSE